jgi:4-hydroxy-tetrahydrodipicolinate synthase
MLDGAAFRGIFVIVTTPFTDALEVDEAALRATVRFCREAKVHGLVANAIASEGGYLSEAERLRVAEIVVEEAAGAVPVVVGVSSSHHRISATYARHAEQVGAAAIMSLPPTFHPPTLAEIRTFYRELAAATALPIILQNAIGPGATPMSPQLLAELVNQLPNAPFVKEETAYPAQVTGELIALAGPRLRGVMGGKAGKTLMEELRHGMCGTMPACEVADVHVALWSAIEAGEDARARHIFRLLLPLLDLEGNYGAPLMKEVLKLRGIIPGAAVRQTGLRPLDDHARAELRLVLADLAELMLPAYLPLP